MKFNVPVHVIAVGALKTRHWRAAQDEYAERLRHYVDFHLVEVKDFTGKLPDAVAVPKEGAALVTAAGGLRRIALTEHGPTMSSPALAVWLRQQLETYPGGLAFLIAGPVGWDAAALARCAGQLSLSPLTLPHELARVVLLEQLYRALTIIGGEGYHK